MKKNLNSCSVILKSKRFKGSPRRCVQTRSGDPFVPPRFLTMERLRPATLSKSLVTSSTTVNKGPRETGVHNGHPEWGTGVRPAGLLSSSS